MNSLCSCYRNGVKCPGFKSTDLNKTVSFTQIIVWGTCCFCLSELFNIQTLNLTTTKTISQSRVTLRPSQSHNLPFAWAGTWCPPSLLIQSCTLMMSISRGKFITERWVCVYVSTKGLHSCSKIKHFVCRGFFQILCGDWADWRREIWICDFWAQN